MRAYRDSIGWLRWVETHESRFRQMQTAGLQVREVWPKKMIEDDFSEMKKAAMDGDRVYKKTTFLTEYLNKPVASELITISDNPTIPRHSYSVPFDGEGNITRKNILIDKGILKMFIYDTITARKAGVKVNTLATRYGYITPPWSQYINVVKVKLKQLKKNTNLNSYSL